MERRKFIIGAGALATGSAAATGTGAFSQMDAEREVNVPVVNDSTALIALVPGDEGGSVYESENPGELTIDFTTEDGDGLNTNSRYQVGTFHHSYVGIGSDLLEKDHVMGTRGNTMEALGYAFRIDNHSDETRDISVEFEANEEEVEGYLGFGIEGSWGGSINERPRDAIEIQGTETEDSVEFTVDSGDSLFASFVVSTLDVTDLEEDLSGTLTVEAE